MLMYYVYLKKGFYHYDYWNSFEKFKEGLASKDNLDESKNSWTNQKISNKNFERALKV